MKLFIDGKFVESKSDKWIDIHNPVSKAALGFKLTSLEFWERGGKLGTWVFVMKYLVLPLWLDEKRRRGTRGKRWCPAFSHQATNEVIGHVPLTTKAEMDAAVASCKRAFPAWADTSVLSRQQILLRYQQLIKENLVRIRMASSFKLLPGMQKPF